MSTKGVDVKHYMMKKILVMALSLFVLLSFNSCDKAKQLEGTSWDGKIELKFSDSDEYEGTSYRWEIVEKGDISISFAGDDADIVVKMKGTIQSWSRYWDYYWGEWVEDYDTESFIETYKGTATYSCEKDKITFSSIKWKDDLDELLDDLDGKWSGTFDGTTMTLKNVFGETVKFTK